MRNVFLSVLGTSNYVPCNYMGYKNIRFIQEATIASNCQNWLTEDRIYILTTDAAYDANWLNGGHKGTEVGLKSRLERLNLSAKLDYVSIPLGESVDEIWGIFETIYGLIEEDDNVVFDITHAFRSLPMLAIVVLNYAKAMKNINLQGIYYGAFEVLGSPRYVEDNVPVEERNVPVFDLSAFDMLMDWSFAVDHFIKAGDASAISALAKKEIKPVLAESKGRNENARSTDQLAKALEKFTRVMATCRGRMISDTVERLRACLAESYSINDIKPFQPIVERLRDQVESSFCGETVPDGFNAARWCLNHNLIQQGYTILQETLFSYLLIKAGLDPHEDRYRDIPSQALKIYSSRKSDEPIEKADWHSPACDYPEITERIIRILPGDPDFTKQMHRISQERNDLNHAGQNQNAYVSPEKFSRNLATHINYMEQLVSEE